MTNYDKFDGFDNAIKYQIFVNNNDTRSNRIELIRLSKIIFADTEYDVRFDYEQMIFTDRECSNIIEIEPFTNIYDVFVSIPCLIHPIHVGVRCKIVDHLSGIGCIDCFYDHDTFPRE